jgi:nicotinamidase-related amidase
MATVTENLHGSAPDKSKTALLLIDVINDLDFPEAAELLRFALPMAKRLADLAKHCRMAGIPVIYVNDNFGRWRSDFKVIIEYCLRDESKGKDIVRQLQPEVDDYFVLKPKHSGFFSTTLDTLLKYLEVETVILTGIAGNICVLFSANDAYMRDLAIVIPRDCVVSNSQDLNEYAFRQMETVLKADLRESTELSLAKLKELK